MSSDRVRVGVVGTSAHAETVHLTNLASHPGAQIAAICGRNRERAEVRARKFDIPRVFTDYREMIARGNLDALVVATPDDLHYPITMEALDAGLHVLCEKPLALDATQAREMYQRAKARGVIHMAFFSWRWPPAQRFLHALIDQGYLGQCLECELRFVHGFGRHHDYEWRFDPGRSQGVLGDLGSHMIDLVQWYLGDITQVSASLSTFVERSAADGSPGRSANDAAFLTIQLASGARGIIHVSAVASEADREMEQRIVLHGELGTLEADYTSLGTEVRGTREGDAEFQVLPIPDEIWGDVDRRDPLGVFRRQSVGDRGFIDAIVQGRSASPSFREGVRVQRVIDAAIESARSGRWVSVEPLDE